MKIITKEIDKLLEIEGKKVQHDIETGNTSSQLNVVCHLFHPYSNWDWYLIGYSMKGNKDYIFALTKGHELEYGDVFLPELLELRVHMLPIERELIFKPIDAKELYNKLNK
jgi:hypothetical protein